MGKLIILNGPAASGKTTWARISGYTVTGNFNIAVDALRDGKDVVFDSEYFNGHTVEVKTFTHTSEEK